MLRISTRAPLPAAIRGVSRRRARTCRQHPDQSEGFGRPYVRRSSNSKHKHATVFSVIREIEIWRVAMLMVNRYAEGAGANSFQRAEQLAAEGDHAGVAIWRRITGAIEQLTDATGLLN